MDIRLPDTGTAIELKYLTRTAVISHDDEEFRLKDQSARDLGRYGFCLDISRLEGIIRRGKATDGYAILLTNDHLYWSHPKKTNANDADFVIHEDRVINGTLAWSASARTKEGRDNPINIRGLYRADWPEFSGPLGTGHIRFRYLLVSMGNQDC